MQHRSLLVVPFVMIAAGLAAAPQERATFRSAADLVSVAVVVRDGSGRLVPGLRASDFQILEGQAVRPIAQFQAGYEADARLALLVDSSGSMVIGDKPARTRTAADLLLAGMRGADSAAVFAFDSGIRRLTPYTGDVAAIRSAIAGVAPFGATCLFDAIVDASHSIQDDAPRARALVLLTDGIDTASAHSVDDAAATAARLDVPIYVLGVGLSPDEAQRAADQPDRPEFTIGDLARRTGGLAAEAASPSQLSVATRTILDELHFQYLLAFPASPEPGWHPLQVRVRNGRVNARSRDGYFVAR